MSVCKVSGDVLLALTLPQPTGGCSPPTSPKKPAHPLWEGIYTSLDACMSVLTPPPGLGPAVDLLLQENLPSRVTFVCSCPPSFDNSVALLSMTYSSPAYTPLCLEGIGVWVAPFIIGMKQLN